MAHVSPRVFWNLVKHCGGDVRAGLQQLLPNTDWAFLDERKRARSGKAVANIRQAAEAAHERAAVLGGQRTDAAEIKKLKVPELKEQLKERGLETTGKKDELVARLEASLAAEAAAEEGAEAAAEEAGAGAPAAEAEGAAAAAAAAAAGASLARPPSAWVA